LQTLPCLVFVKWSQAPLRGFLTGERSLERLGTEEDEEDAEDAEDAENEEDAHDGGEDGGEGGGEDRDGEEGRSSLILGGVGVCG